MHHYLRSVGFSKIEKRKDVDKLMKSIIKENILNAESSIDFAGDTRLEVRAWTAENMGLTLVGVLDARSGMKLDAYYPFLMTQDISTVQNVTVYERTQGQIFSGLLEDQRIGLTLIYLIDNPNDYMRIREQDLEIKECRTKLAGFSTDGVILLPSMKKVTVPVPVDNAQPQEKMGIGAFGGWKGDIDNVPPELEEMAIKEMSVFASVSRRVQNEDVYSIVDTSFMPHGVETDVYSIIGDILEVQKVKNIITGEDVWNMKVCANDMVLHVVINALDLNGEPAVGRRFKGSIWLMGRTEFVV